MDKIFNPKLLPRKYTHGHLSCEMILNIICHYGNVNDHHNEILLHTHCDHYRQIIASVDKNMKKCKMVQLLWKTL
jgi:hypothetical protein